MRWIAAISRALGRRSTAGHLVDQPLVDMPGCEIFGGTLRSSHVRIATFTTSWIAVGLGLISPATSFADDVGADPSMPGPVQVATVGTSADADPAAVTACAAFAEVLDGSATYYGDFADTFEGSDYADPAVSDSNVVGRTALRQAAGVAMTAANTPGLQPEIADPVRKWSVDATKLLVKMGLRIPGDSLNTTATEMNDDATKAQEACAAAGTHA
jgi:hypothetical protein